MEKTKTGKYLLIAAAVIFALLCVRLLLYRESMIFWALLLVFAVIAFLVWKAYIKNGSEDLRRARRKERELEGEVDDLKKEIAGLTRELEEKGRSRLNVVELSPILHLAVLNIDSSFVRTYVREEGGISFNGAIRADICAEYGVRLEDVGFKLDPASGVLELANFKPGLISYSKKQLEWELARSCRERSFLGRKFLSADDAQARAYTERMCSELRTGLEKEIDERKIAEFEWLSPLVSQQVTDMLKLIIGRPDIRIITHEGTPEGTYLDFPSFRRQFSVSGTTVPSVGEGHK